MSNTDTLDAIAREMRTALRHNDYESDWIKDWAARIEAITALSNQGEGAEPVAWAIELPDGNIGGLGWCGMQKLDSAKEFGVLAGGCRYVFAYRHPVPAEADRRDADHAD